MNLLRREDPLITKGLKFMFLLGSFVQASDAPLDSVNIPKTELRSNVSSYIIRRKTVSLFFESIALQLDDRTASDDLCACWEIFTSKSIYLGRITREMVNIPRGEGPPHLPGGIWIRTHQAMNELVDAWRSSVEELHTTRQCELEITLAAEREARTASETFSREKEEENVRLHALLAARERERDDARTAVTAVAGDEDELFGAMESW